MMRFAVAVVCQKAQSMWLHFILGFSILLPVHLVLNDAVSEQYIVMVNLILGVFIAVSLNHVLKGIFDQDFFADAFDDGQEKVVPFVAMVMAAFFCFNHCPWVVWYLLCQALMDIFSCCFIWGCCMP